MTGTHRLATAAITVFLFLTGASGLVYQVLWSRYLALLLGSSAVATVVVLAAFMGGLAAGSWIFGRAADRPVRRLSLYAWLELGVGLYCAAFPGIFSASSRPWFRIVSPLYGSHPAAFLAARLLFAGLLLLPPTILMGGTLPAASRFLLGLEPGVRRAVGRLYWVNSAGAVAGALLAGFWMVPNLGLDLCMTAGATVNVVVGIAALALRNRVGEDPAARPPEDAAEPALSARAAGFAVAAVALSGFSALALEVAWTRLLALVLGGSTYAFTLMLATFILGIAIGSRLVARPRFARADPVVLLGSFLALVAALLALMMPLYPRLPYVFQAVGDVIRRTPRAYPIYQGGVFLVCLGVMILPTIAMGATLPLASRISARSAEALGTRIGLTYAANTVGTLLGAALCGLVLLPFLSLQGTMSLVTVLYAVAAGLALLGSEPAGRRRALAVGVVAVAAVAAVPLLPRWNGLFLASGAFRTRELADKSFTDWARRWKESARLLFHEDGPTATVSVLEDGSGDRMLRVNGKTDASVRQDLPTQLLLGHIPLLLAPKPATRAMVVGLGSGATAAAVASHPGVEVDVVEIEPEVVRAARLFFTEVNDHVLERANVHVHVDDAKTFFLLTHHRYDVVVSEPSNPWVAGIGGLFTEEYFAQARSRLRPGGVMAQWMHTYEIADEDVRLVLRTFRRVFPVVSVWHTTPGDVVLVGTLEPLAPDFDEMERRIAVPAVASGLSRVAINSLAAVLARQVLSPATVALAAGTGAVNSDQFPVLEFAAPRGFFLNARAMLLDELDERSHSLGGHLLIEAYLARHPLGADQAVVLAQSLGLEGPLSEALLQAARRLDPGNLDPVKKLTNALAREGRRPQAKAVLDAAEPRGAGWGPRPLRLQFEVALETCRSSRTVFTPRGDCSEAIRLGERLVGLPDVPGAERRADLGDLASALLSAGRFEAASALYDKVLADGDGADPPARRAAWLSGAAAASLRRGDRARARVLARQALSLEPRDPAALLVLAASGAEARAGAP